MVIITEEDRVIQGRDNINIWTSQSLSSLLASQTTTVNGQPSQRRRLLDYHNDAWASQELINFLVPV